MTSKNMSFELLLSIGAMVLILTTIQPKIPWSISLNPFRYDIMGFCPMALDFIEIDTGIDLYKKPLSEWKEFAEYYNCKRKAAP